MEKLVSSSSKLTKNEKIELLGFEVSYGSTLGWTIELSTLPDQRGAKLLKGRAATMSSQEVKAALSNSMALEMGGIHPLRGWRAVN